MGALTVGSHSRGGRTLALTIGRRSRAVVLSAVGAGAITFGLVAPGVFAAGGPPPTSSLVPSATSLTIDLQNVAPNANPQSLTVGLDANCPNALAGGLSYGVSVGTFDTSIVKVDQTSGDSGLQCTKNGPGQPAGFNVTGLKCGKVNVPFDPIIGNNGNGNPGGQQGKVGGTSVAVTVFDSNDPTCGGTTTTTPSGSGLPAAPGVANTYIGASSTTYAKNCKNFVNTNNWRGVVISAVAAWMPRPESLKDDPTVFPGYTGVSWETYVTSEVDHLCTGSAFSYAAPTSLPGAHTS